MQKIVRILDRVLSLRPFLYFLSHPSPLGCFYLVFIRQKIAPFQRLRVDAEPGAMILPGSNFTGPLTLLNIRFHLHSIAGSSHVLNDSHQVLNNQPSRLSSITTDPRIDPRASLL